MVSGSPPDARFVEAPPVHTPTDTQTQFERDVIRYDTIRYDTRCYFNVRSKADISQLNLPHGTCGDAFPIEGVLVATYLLSVEALPHCRCGVANKNRIV